MSTGRCRVLLKALLDIEDRHPEHSLEGGPAAVHAFWVAHIPDSHLVVRGSVGRKVSSLKSHPPEHESNTSDARIVASLVRAQPVPFLLNILKWLLVAIPATWTNSQLNYVQSKLALAYRTRLTNEVITKYLGDEENNDKVYYKLGPYSLDLVLSRHLTGVRSKFG